MTFHLHQERIAGHGIVCYVFEATIALAKFNFKLRLDVVNKKMCVRLRQLSWLCYLLIIFFLLRTYCSTTSISTYLRRLHQSRSTFPWIPSRTHIASIYCHTFACGICLLVADNFLCKTFFFWIFFLCAGDAAAALKLFRLFVNDLV